MKLKFLATGSAPEYAIDGETINGLDLSIVDHGGQFIRTEETEAAGIRDVYRDASGELYVTLKQTAPVTVVIDGRAYSEGDWRESEEWIDAEDYDPEALYIVDVTPGGAPPPLSDQELQGG